MYCFGSPVGQAKSTLNFYSTTESEHIALFITMREPLPFWLLIIEIHKQGLVSTTIGTHSFATKLP
jgi:hypothetical protein